MRRLAMTLLVAAVAACNAAPAVTPQIIYVTPEPTVTASPTASPTAAAQATASPTQEPTPSPSATPSATPTRPPATPQPTPRPTAPPTPEPTVELDVTFDTLTKRQWSRLVRSPDDHVMEAIRIWGCISQFDTATGPDSFRAQASHRKETYWFSNGENSLFSGDASELDDFVKDDVFRADVYVMGSFEYESTLGGQITVPMFLIVNIDRLRGSC